MGDNGEVDLYGEDGAVLIGDDGNVQICGDCCVIPEPGEPCGNCDEDTTPLKLKLLFSGVDAGVCPCIPAGSITLLVTELNLDGLHCLTQTGNPCVWEAYPSGSWAANLYDNPTCSGEPTSQRSGGFFIQAVRINPTTWYVTADFTPIGHVVCFVFVGPSLVAETDCGVPFVANNTIAACVFRGVELEFDVSTAGSVTGTPHGC